MSEAADFEDRDLADLTMRVIANQRSIDAIQAAINGNQAAINGNRAAINTLGVQTAERFMHLEARMDAGFDEVKGKLDVTTAGLAQIVRLLSPGPGDN